MPNHPSDACPYADNRRFATTHWSAVLAAGVADRGEPNDALAQLCEAYWHPLYAYVRRRGYRADDAQDLVQAFLARLLDKQILQAADPHRGKFRSFLLSSMDNFLANERDRAHAKKRGGDRIHLSLDLASAESRLHLEPADRLTPERLFLRQWAMALLDVVVGRLQREFEVAGKGGQFDVLRETLTGSVGRPNYGKMAAALEMTPDALRQAAHRMRKRYRAILREEVTRTSGQQDDVDGEIASLIAALGN